MAEQERRWGERALSLLRPAWGQAAYERRQRREKQSQEADVREADAQGPAHPEDGRGQEKQMATGYGNHGASTTKNSLVGWLADGGSAEEDIDLHGGLLSRRSRDLYAGGGLARSGPSTLTTSVVGWAIKPKPHIEGEVLGLDAEQCAAWERKTLREFLIWAENAMCDASRQQNFWGLQELAFRSQLVSGDVFALFGMKENKRTPYRTVIRLLERDRVCTPDSEGESESVNLEGGRRIVDGVEIDREGMVLRYHIASRHPLAEDNNAALTWTAIEAYGADTGYPNILQLMTFERPEQRRGIPFVAAMIEQIKKLDRYISSELAANIVASMLTVFLTSKDENGTFPMMDAVGDGEKVTDDELKIELAEGAVYKLPPGIEVHAVNPIRSNSAFEAFVTKMETLIGSSMEIPQEVLLKKYDRNYTAARGALLDFWRVVRRYRARFNYAFNQPVYEQWLSEAVALGRVEAPGFFDDIAIRSAWCGCQWMGASAGHVDPVKEARAAETRIRLNISTEEQEAMEYNGNSYDENIRQRAKEIAHNRKLEEEGKGESPNKKEAKA